MHAAFTKAFAIMGASSAGADTSSGCTKVMIFLTDGVNSGRWAARPTRPADSAPNPNLKKEGRDADKD